MSNYINIAIIIISIFIQINSNTPPKMLYDCLNEPGKCYVIDENQVYCEFKNITNTQNFRNNITANTKIFCDDSKYVHTPLIAEDKCDINPKNPYYCKYYSKTYGYIDCYNNTDSNLNSDEIYKVCNTYELKYNLLFLLVLIFI
jgi:hypothetical protein